MNEANGATLHRLASAFRDAIEQTRADKAPGALPYFPDGACRLTSRLFAMHIARRPDSANFGHVQLVSGVVPTSTHESRHFWLEIDLVVVDLTADPFGQPPVIVGAPTAFHQSLSSSTREDATLALAALGAEEATRLARQLSAIESRLAKLAGPSA